MLSQLFRRRRRRGAGGGCADRGSAWRRRRGRAPPIQRFSRSSSSTMRAPAVVPTSELPDWSTACLVGSASSTTSVDRPAQQELRDELRNAHARRAASKPAPQRVNDDANSRPCSVAKS
ncbi:hypothetical protein ACP4OV_018486 [Aristida adscensionis]